MAKYPISKLLYFIWIFFASAVLGIKYFIRLNNTVSNLHWHASRDLQPLHQLNKADLYLNGTLENFKLAVPLDSLIGRHLLQKKGRGDTIRLVDVSTFPKVVSIPKNSMVWLIPLRKDESLLNTLVNEGTWIQMCSVGPPDGYGVGTCSDSLKVIAVHSPIDSTDNAFWLVQLPSTRSKEISNVAVSKNRYILVK